MVHSVACESTSFALKGLVIYTFGWRMLKLRMAFSPSAYRVSVHHIIMRTTHLVVWVGFEPTTFRVRAEYSASWVIIPCYRANALFHTISIYFYELDGAADGTRTHDVFITGLKVRSSRRYGNDSIYHWFSRCCRHSCYNENNTFGTADWYRTNMNGMITVCGFGVRCLTCRATAVLKINSHRMIRTFGMSFILLLRSHFPS